MCAAGLNRELKKVNIMLDNNLLDRVPCELLPFPGYLLFVGVKPPKTYANQSQHNDEDNNDLPG